jgi:hypothetical protein
MVYSRRVALTKYDQRPGRYVRQPGGLPISRADIAQQPGGNRGCSRRGRRIAIRHDPGGRRMIRRRAIGVVLASVFALDLAATQGKRRGFDRDRTVGYLLDPDCAMSRPGRFLLRGSAIRSAPPTGGTARRWPGWSAVRESGGIGWRPGRLRLSGGPSYASIHTERGVQSLTCCLPCLALRRTWLR